MARPSVTSIPNRLAHASLADVCRWITRYRDILAKLSVPPKLSATEMIVKLFPDATATEAESCRLEFLRDYEFANTLQEKTVLRRRRGVAWRDWNEFLYMAIRFAKPRVVFETGVFDGQSSAIILRALEKNRDGELVSIDLPATETIQGSTNFMPETTLPPGCQPGWLVPDSLRDKYHLALGDSRELLPKLLQKYHSIDVFFHDSLHTFEHMYFEYRTAWPCLSEGGLLLSDDISWNRAFHQFSKEAQRRYVRMEGFGAVRK